MSQDNPIHKKIIDQFGDPDAGKSDTEQKIKVFNFEALKGTIANDEQFRIAVAGLQKFNQENPGAFDELQASMEQARDDKHERLGITGMSSGEILDSVFDDVNKLPPEERQAALDKIARVKKNVGDEIDYLGKGKGAGGKA